MKKKMYVDILSLFVPFTVLPLIMLLLLGERHIIGIAPFLFSIFAVNTYKYHKKEDSFIRVIFLAAAFAFLIGIFCLWGFVFFPKLVLKSSLIKLSGIRFYIYWVSQFSLISLSSITFALLDWKGDSRLSRRIGIYGIIVGLCIFIVIVLMTGLLKK